MKAMTPNDWSREIGKLCDDILTEENAMSIKDVVDQAKHAAHVAADKAKEAAKEAAEFVKETAHETKEQVEHLVDEAKEAIHKKPEEK